MPRSPRGPLATVLDIGAGTGFFVIAAARLGYEVTALDLSAQMLARLRIIAHHEKVNLTIVEGAAHARLPDRSMWPWGVAS